MKRFMAALVLAASAGLPLWALAQIPATSADPLIEDAPLVALAQAWNQARNEGDREAILALIYPPEQELARKHLFLRATEQRRGIARLRLISIQANKKDRLTLIVERSWGGSNPGRSEWQIEASEFNSFWYLRFPGGDLQPPRGALPTASRQASRSDPPPTEIKLNLKSAPFTDGKAVTSTSSISAIAAPPPPTPAAPASPSPVAKEELTAGSKKFEAWVRQCERQRDNSLDCHVEHQAGVADNKRLFMNWRFSFDENARLNLQVLTPNRVLLGPGVDFFLGTNRPLKAPFWICGEASCELSFALDEPTRRALAQARTFTAHFSDEDGSKVSFEVPTAGLQAALATLPELN